MKPFENNQQVNLYEVSDQWLWVIIVECWELAQFQLYASK